MREEIQFLKDLQEELKTQEIDCQASPRFWVLMDYRTVPTHPEYDMDRMEYYFNDGDHTVFNTIDDLKEFLTDHFLEDEDENEDFVLESILEKDDMSFDDLWKFTKSNLNDDGYFDEVPVKEESFIVPDTMFLTKAEAKRHIELNRHHYTKKVHTYAMTAWRAPKVQRLLNILESFNWDSVTLQEDK